MSCSGYTVEVANLSPCATEGDLYEFFSFSGAIEHIEIIRCGDYASTAYVTFKEAHSVETAILLSGATIVDQHVCIIRWGQCNEGSNFWDNPSSGYANEHMSEAYAYKFSTTPGEVVTVAQDVVKTMLAKGYVLSKDALAKAKALDESYNVSATAAAKVAELSRRVGLTDKIHASADALRSADQQYHVSDIVDGVKSVVGATGKTVVATGRTAAAVATTVVNSSYFAAGAKLVSDALSKAAKATAEFGSHGTSN